MGHKITFENVRGFILTENEIRDIIEMFYRWGDANFRIVVKNDRPPERGSHQYLPFSREHVIELFPENIKRDFANGVVIAGNIKNAPSLKAAVAMVIVHELQHANQQKLFEGQGMFYGKTGGTTPTGKAKMKRYKGRACEREARAYVDENINQICAYFDLKPTGRQVQSRAESGVSEELQSVIELLAECDGVTSDDVKDELRASNLLRPSSVQIVKQELRKRGIEVR